MEQVVESWELFFVTSKIICILTDAQEVTNTIGGKIKVSWTSKKKNLISVCFIIRLTKRERERERERENAKLGNL